MDTIHDLGGREGFGPIPGINEDDSELFHEPWQARTWAICMMMFGRLQKDQTGWVDYYRKQPNISGTLKSVNPEYQTAHYGKWDHRFDGVSPAEMGYDDSDGPTGNGEGGANGSGGPAAKEDPKLIDHITRSKKC